MPIEDRFGVSVASVVVMENGFAPIPKPPIGHQISYNEKGYPTPTLMRLLIAEGDHMIGHF
jgi:hypothetical protein